MWTELQTRVQQESKEGVGARDTWMQMLNAIESLIAQLESPDGLHPAD